MEIMTLIGSVLGALLFMAYYTPTYIAFKRQHEDRYTILFLNCLFGLTIVIWAGCLIWAHKSPKENIVKAIPSRQKNFVVLCIFLTTIIQMFVWVHIMQIEKERLDLQRERHFQQEIENIKRRYVQ